MAFRRPSYLVRRGNVFTFRMAVPRDLWTRCGLREVKGSLRTSDPFTARTRCRTLSNAFEGLIREIPAMPEIPPDVFKRLIRSYFQDLLNKGEEIAFLTPQDQALDIGYEAKETLAYAMELKKRLVTQNYDGPTRTSAGELLSQVRRASTILRQCSDQFRQPSSPSFQAG